jgi:hypothetical protein
VAPARRSRGPAPPALTGWPGALDRHLALGAGVTAALEYWTVLTAPAGRAYCLISRDPA